MNDLEYEMNFAANVAVDRYSTWEAYDQHKRLSERFKPEQLAEIRDAYERWKRNNEELRKVLEKSGES